MTEYELVGPGRNFDLEVTPEAGGYKVLLGGKVFHLKLEKGREPGQLVAQLDNTLLKVRVESAGAETIVLSLGDEPLSYRRFRPSVESRPIGTTAGEGTKDTLTSPLPGRVITVAVVPGAKVKAGDSLLVIESMKMETAIRSDRDGRIEAVMVMEGSSVKRGSPLIRFKS